MEVWEAFLKRNKKERGDLPPSCAIKRVCGRDVSKGIRVREVLVE